MPPCPPRSAIFSTGPAASRSGPAETAASTRHSGEDRKRPMIEHLKRGKPEADRAEDDAKVRSLVEATLKDIEARGDAAVRELSEKFDKYSPASFRLSSSEIEALMGKVSARDMEDIKFAQAQVRKI